MINPVFARKTAKLVRISMLIDLHALLVKQVNIKTRMTNHLATGAVPVRTLVLTDQAVLVAHLESSNKQALSPPFH